MAVVVDGILIDDALDFILGEVEVVAGTLLDAALDCFGVLEGTKTRMLGGCGVQSAELYAFGQMQTEAHLFSFSSFLLLTRRFVEFGVYLPFAEVVSLEEIHFDAFLRRECWLVEFAGVGEAVDGEVVVEIVEVLDDAVTPGRRNVSPDRPGEERSSGALEMVVAAGPRFLQHDNKFK